MIQFQEFISKAFYLLYPVLYSDGGKKPGMLGHVIFSLIFGGDIKYFMTKSGRLISFIPQIMARASDPGDSPTKIMWIFGLFKMAEIPGVTSKFAISCLQGFAPSMSMQIGFHDRGNDVVQERLFFWLVEEIDKIMTWLPLQKKT